MDLDQLAETERRDMEVADLQTTIMSLEQEVADLKLDVVSLDEVAEIAKERVAQHQQLLRIIRRLWENPELRRIVDAGLAGDWDQALDYDREDKA